MSTLLETHEDLTQQTDRTRTWFVVSLFGFLLIALGLASDFVLHANDPALAGNEGLFTVTNPGHWSLWIGIVTTAVGLTLATISMLKTEGGESKALRLGGVALGVGIVVLSAAAVYVVAGPGFGHVHGNGISEEVLLSDGVDRSRLPREQAVALAALAWSRPGSLDAEIDHSIHAAAAGTGDDVDENGALAAALARATRAAERLDTVEEITALGYVQASGVTDGAGAHWIKWSIVDQPFDLDNPAMLLFDELKRGEPPQLIAFSYWVAGQEAPEGYPGDTDEWHPHLGMCFQNGWLKDDNLPKRSLCDGDWINGSDLYMLHAWIVPGVENEYGVFHTVNPLLCERACGLEN